MRYKIDDTLYYNIHPANGLKPYSMVPLIVLGTGQITLKEGVRNIYVVKYRFNNQWQEAILKEGSLTHKVPFIQE